MLGCRAHRAARLFRLAVVKYRLRSSFPTPSYRAWHIQGIFWLMVVKCGGARNLAISIPLPRYGSALKGYTFIVCHSVSKRSELGRKIWYAQRRLVVRPTQACVRTARCKRPEGQLYLLCQARCLTCGRGSAGRGSSQARGLSRVPSSTCARSTARWQARQPYREERPHAATV
jgi:hypothetical protein